ncbi:ferredoxin--NADP reductase [Salinispira pacifica]|uniref:Flavodoxin reductases (Ferredoxin-NADPH reductases) family 1 n=1 Tax=Salinispira pacifica TaxID=1307761 RepID=V5WFU6_9SPIO|nr:FAD-dependent oxidoreductase [Salinispira pacifica]AHC14016.1 Flavodoxin reductases (ferredoxin-NADPH reductases) family 1 [Salinispira pacifica]
MSTLLKKILKLISRSVRRLFGLPPVRMYQQRIDSIENEFGQCFTYYLSPLSARDEVRFIPGQYTHVKAPGSPFAKQYIRHLSFASLPGQPLVFSMDLSSSSEFKEAFRKVKPGAVIELFKTKGAFTLSGLDRSHHAVFIAGGIGVTPIRSLILEIERRKAEIPSSPPSYEFVHVGKNYLYHGQLESGISARYIDRKDVPQTIESLAESDSLQKRYYISGPHEFVSDLSSMLIAAGVSAERIKMEDFSH